MVMAEKRRFQRKTIALRLDVSCGKNILDSARVQTLNLSKAGALIESPDPLFVGEVCVFSLTTDSGQSAAIRGHVIWVEHHTGGSYREGVAFRNLTADEEYLLDLQLARGAN